MCLPKTDKFIINQLISRLNTYSHTSLHSVDIALQHLERLQVILVVYSHTAINGAL